MATVAIITPIHATLQNQRLGLFSQTLRSVQRQTSQSYVHIVVDDGSTADVPGYLKSIGDPQVRYVRRERKADDLRTASNPLNLGIDMCLDKNPEVITPAEAADLEAVTYLHSDDLLTPDSVRLRLQSLGSGYVHTSMGFFRNDGELVKIAKWDPARTDLILALAHHSLFNHHTAMWNIDFLKYLRGFVAERYGHSGVFDPGLSHGEDRDAAISSAEAAEQGNFAISYVPSITVWYRHHSNSISEEVSPDYVAQQHELILKKHGISPIEAKAARNPGPLFYLKSHLPPRAKALLRAARSNVKRLATRIRNRTLVNNLEELIST